MRKYQITAAILVGLLITLGCGKKDDGSTNPTPAPGAGGPSTQIGNCPNVGGGTPISNVPFTGRLYSQQGANYQNYNQISSITLNPYIINNGYYSYSGNNVVASGSITLANLAYLYPNSKSAGPSACITSPGGAQATSNTGTFSNGQVSSLVLTGTMQIPYYSPFSVWGSPTGAPGTNPTLGQQLIQVIVGSSCVATFVPSYGNNPGRIRGCVSVRMGTQYNAQTLNYQAQ
jgi:hypothetical protein